MSSKKPPAGKPSRKRSAAVGRNAKRRVKPQRSAARTTKPTTKPGATMARAKARTARHTARPTPRQRGKRREAVAASQSHPRPAPANGTTNGVAARAHASAKRHHNGTPTNDLAARLPLEQARSSLKDRIVCMVRDPYWLHCTWELTRQAVQRAEAALAQAWHGAKPILRLVDVTSTDASCVAERVVRDIEIHGGSNHWYVQVDNPPRSYRLDIGYLSQSGKFFTLARSNVVSTPPAGVSDILDGNWSDLDSEKARRIFAMSSAFDPSACSLELKQLFEERLRRPLGTPATSGFGTGAVQHGKPRTFWFQMDAELIVYGATEPTAKVIVRGEPIRLRKDGTFTMRYSLPDSRQIIPAVARSADGIEERTVVVAVERNTKRLEPVIKDVND